MTDNKIIKALECCREWKCKECPYYIKETDGCKEIDEQDILDLINRLQKENDDLFYKLQGVMWSVDKWLDGNELKQHEVNRAITMREKTLQITEKQQAEIERLKKSRDDLYEEMSERQKEEVKIARKMGKSEAYKELTEKLYEKIEQNAKFGFAYVTKKEIENVVRELEGEE